MSYVRFGEADLYIYLDVAHCLTCCGCWLDQDDHSYAAESTAEMVAHVREHIAAGHQVPDDLIAALEADAEENDAYMADKTDQSGKR